jgi:hypothetical protein
MPLTPENVPPEPTLQALPRSVVRRDSTTRSSRWIGWVFTTLFWLLALAIGFFLVVFPWTEAWNINDLRVSVPGLEGIWGELYLRVAFTVVGFLNLYIASLQFARLLQRS